MFIYLYLHTLCHRKIQKRKILKTPPIVKFSTIPTKLGPYLSTKKSTPKNQERKNLYSYFNTQFI